MVWIDYQTLIIHPERLMVLDVHVLADSVIIAKILQSTATRRFGHWTRLGQAPLIVSIACRKRETSCQAFADLLTNHITNHIMPSRQHFPRENINRNSSEESSQSAYKARVSSHVFQGQ